MGAIIEFGPYLNKKNTAANKLKKDFLAYITNSQHIKNFLEEKLKNNENKQDQKPPISDN